MAWTLRLYCKEPIKEQDLEDIISRLPEEYGTYVSKNDWGWGALVDICYDQSTGKVYLHGAITNHSGSLAGGCANYLVRELKKKGYAVSKSKLRW